MPSWMPDGWAGPGWKCAAAMWRVRCFAANCASVDDIRGDEYSEVTYSTQRAMAGDKHKQADGLSACVSGELLNIILHGHWTKHVYCHANSLFSMNTCISFQTLGVAYARGDSIFLIMSLTLTISFDWQVLPRGPRQLSFNTSSAMGSMCHPSNHESSLRSLFI